MINKHHIGYLFALCLKVWLAKKWVLFLKCAVAVENIYSVGNKQAVGFCYACSIDGSKGKVFILTRILL